MKESSARVFWIDWAKAILIALVCVGHFNSPETQRMLIYGCHMPAFFIISGFLYHRHGAWRTFISFVVPIMFYTAIIFGVHIIQDCIQNGYWNYQLDLGHFWHRVLEQFILRNSSNPYGIIELFWIWFIVALIVARFLCGDIKWFSLTLKYRYVTLAVLLLWLTIEPMIWDYISIKDVKLYYGIYALPFFITGYIVKDLKFDVSKIHPLIILLSFVLYVIITLISPRFDMMNYQCGPTFMVFYINAICGSLALFGFCSKLPQSRLAEVFSIGTLLILTLHMPLDFFILPVFHRIGLTPPNTLFVSYLIPWLEMGVVLLVTYYPITWLNMHFPLLLGKMPKIIVK